jgi:hypothetical protein
VKSKEMAQVEMRAAKQVFDNPGGIIETEVDEE